MEIGNVLCLKTTGELVMVLNPTDDLGVATVRRPTMGRDGIRHTTDKFFGFELETPEEHLRHEAKEMVLKVRIQRETQDAVEAEEAEKTVDISVN